MTDKKMPEVRPNALMESAFDVLISVRKERSGAWYGSTYYYLSPRRDIAYEQRMPVKTKQEAVDKQRRETIAFLEEMRKQIDDVLSRLNGAPLDEHDMIHVPSYAYQQKDDPS